jgi:hypothetical protein
MATAGLFLSAQSLLAQRQQVPVAPSELARQNMSHVAASVGQIVAVLHRDPGLMIELKKWIAKDATDHGQLISDADLADEAIFERLETDMSFRSVATLLMQKYGYLQPNVNPDSAAGREQQLLIQERVRFLAQQGAGRHTQRLAKALSKLEVAILWVAIAAQVSLLLHRNRRSNRGSRLRRRCRDCKRRTLLKVARICRRSKRLRITT